MEEKYYANENTRTTSGSETYFTTSSYALEDKDNVLLPKPSSSHNNLSANPHNCIATLQNNAYEYEKQTFSYSVEGFENSSSKSLMTTDATKDDVIDENSSFNIRIPKIVENGFIGKNVVVQQIAENLKKIPDDKNEESRIHSQIKSLLTNNSNSNDYNTSQTPNNENVSTGKNYLIDYKQKITCSEGTDKSLIENSLNFCSEQTGESQNEMFLRLKKMSLDSTLINIKDDVECHKIEKKNNFSSINSLCEYSNIFDTNEPQPSSSAQEKNTEEVQLPEKINCPIKNTESGQEVRSISNTKKQPVSYKQCKIQQNGEDSGILEINGNALNIALCSPSTTKKILENPSEIDIDSDECSRTTAALNNSEQIFEIKASPKDGSYYKFCETLNPCSLTTDRCTSVISSNLKGSNSKNVGESPGNVSNATTLTKGKSCIFKDNAFSKFGLKTKLDFDNQKWETCDEINSSDLEEACRCQKMLACKSQCNSNLNLNDSVELNCEKNNEKFQSLDNSLKSRLNISFGIRKRKHTETQNAYNEDPEVQSNTINSGTKSRKRVAFDLSTKTDFQKSQCREKSSFALHRAPRSLIPTRENPPPELGNWLTQFQQWSNAERLLAIDCLIDYCNPTQVRHMMKIIEPQFQRDFISLLPRELALSVLAYLDPKDLLRASQTCRSWRFLCDDNLLWKEKCRKAKILGEPRFDKTSRGRAGSMVIPSPWKAVYMRQHVIEMNWRSRAIRDPKILKGHDDHVITCLQFSGNRIVSGSDDNTLKVWSAVTGRCLRTLIGHTGGVWSSQMSGNIIISGSTDRTLKVWDMETGQCIHTLMGHTSTVRCMHLHGNKVVSGSRDATLRVWDIHQGNCLHVLIGHLAAVRCVQYDGKLIVSGAYDYMVKIWHPERQECLHTLQGHTNRVYSLQFDGVHVVSGSLDTSIRVWDVETGSCKHTLMGHQSLTSGMELRQNILVSGNADSTVKVWDITTGQCLQTLSGPHKHQSAVTCLQFNSRFVITSSDDGTVKLWDVKTGEFIRNLVNLDSGGSGGVVWRIRANDTKLICAVGSRNGTEETKLMVLDFDVEGGCMKCT